MPRETPPFCAGRAAGCRYSGSQPRQLSSFLRRTASVPGQKTDVTITFGIYRKR